MCGNETRIDPAFPQLYTQNTYLLRFQVESIKTFQFGPLRKKYCLCIPQRTAQTQRHRKSGNLFPLLLFCA